MVTDKINHYTNDFKQKYRCICIYYNVQQKDIYSQLKYLKIHTECILLTSQNLTKLVTVYSLLTAILELAYKRNKNKSSVQELCS